MLVICLPLVALIFNALNTITFNNSILNNTLNNIANRFINLPRYNTWYPSFTSYARDILTITGDWLIPFVNRVRIIKYKNNVPKPLKTCTCTCNVGKRAINSCVKWVKKGYKWLEPDWSKLPIPNSLRDLTVYMANCAHVWK